MGRGQTTCLELLEWSKGREPSAGRVPLALMPLPDAVPTLSLQFAGEGAGRCLVARSIVASLGDISARIKSEQCARG